MPWQASMSTFTEAIDLSNIACSAREKADLDDSLDAARADHDRTPTYMSFTPYWPVRCAAQGSTRFLSLR